MKTNYLYQVQAKLILSVPNIDRNVLYIPHEEKLCIPHIEKMFLFICLKECFSKYVIDKIFIYILAIYKLYILCKDNTSTYDTDKIKISTLKR